MKSKPTEHVPRPPRVIAAGIYSEQDLVHNLQISRAKFREWRRLKSPLRPLGTGTNANLYSAAVVIAFLEGLPEGGAK